MGDSRVEDILEDTIAGNEYDGPVMSRVEELLVELNEAISGGGGSDLPDVTSSDNGKVLKVINGEWGKGDDISNVVHYVNCTVQYAFDYPMDTNRDVIFTGYQNVAAAYTEINRWVDNNEEVVLILNSGNVPSSIRDIRLDMDHESNSTDGLIFVNVLYSSACNKTLIYEINLTNYMGGISKLKIREVTPNELPVPTSQDNGKFVGVSNGSYNLVSGYSKTEIDAFIDATDDALDDEIAARIAGDNAKADVIENTASGSIASFNDGTGKNVDELIVGIEPVQSGSGDPSPSNVRPISGWTGANIYVAPTSDPDDPDKTTTSITWQTEAGTVYGGTLNVTTGELTVDRANIASYDGETLPGKWISDRDVYSVGATPTTGAQVVYELAEPITYQLTPTEVATLVGTNNIWADAGDVTVTYKADTKLYVDNKVDNNISEVNTKISELKQTEADIIAPTEDGTTASQAYATGEYFLRNDQLYKAKTAIASGASFTPGTNCELTNVATGLASAGGSLYWHSVAITSSGVINYATCIILNTTPSNITLDDIKDIVNNDNGKIVIVSGYGKDSSSNPVTPLFLTKSNNPNTFVNIYYLDSTGMVFNGIMTWNIFTMQSFGTDSHQIM